MATTKRKTYPRLRVTRRRVAWSTPPTWVLRVHIVAGNPVGAAYDWGRYATAQDAWDAAADLLHNHWER